VDQFIREREKKLHIRIPRIFVELFPGSGKRHYQTNKSDIDQTLVIMKAQLKNNNYDKPHIWKMTLRNLDRDVHKNILLAPPPPRPNASKPTTEYSLVQKDSTCDRFIVEFARDLKEQHCLVFDRTVAAERDGHQYFRVPTRDIKRLREIFTMVSHADISSKTVNLGDIAMHISRKR
jgi:hypothetical protein